MRPTTRWSAGFARIERLPRARAPNSMRPAQRATTPSATSSSAIRSSRRAGSLTRWRAATPRSRMAVSASASSSEGPRYAGPERRAAGAGVGAEARGCLEGGRVGRPARAPLEAGRLARGEVERRAERRERLLGAAGGRVGREPHHLILVLAGLHTEEQRHERVEGAERARAAPGRLAALERRGARGRDRRAEAVAGVVVGEDERLAAAERRAEVRRRRVAGVVVHDPDALGGEPEVTRDVGAALFVGERRLAGGRVEEAEPGAELARAPGEAAPRRLEADAIVAAPIRLVAHDTGHPLVGRDARAREDDEVERAAVEVELAQERVDRAPRIARVVLQPREALLGCEADDQDVAQDRGRRAMGLADPQDEHPRR